MALEDFEGNTFVAFIDISGFKELIKQENRAWKALDIFYQAAYDNLRRDNTRTGMVRVDGLFISDCGIIFVRGGGSNQDKLQSLLRIIEKINKDMLKHDFMLVTSIAYGHFKYAGRLEFQGIEKNLAYGNSYILAYSDTESGKPPLEPGKCRILIENLPTEIITLLERNNLEGVFRKIKKETTKHYYFYWNMENPDRIADFKTKYKDSYELKYAGMLKALKES